MLEAEGVGEHPRMLVINSETFTVWKDHFARLQKVVAGWEPQGGRLLTLGMSLPFDWCYSSVSHEPFSVGSEHPSFSDFPVLPVVGKKSGQHILDTISKLSLSFLEDKLEDTLRTVPSVDLDIKTIGVKKDGKPKRKLIGNPGDVISSYEGIQRSISTS